MKNLVCLFCKDNYSRSQFDKIRGMSDDVIYKKVQGDLDHTDIYTMGDFMSDFNDNRPYVSPENFYIIFIRVPDSEVSQWMK